MVVCVIYPIALRAGKQLQTARLKGLFSLCQLQGRLIMFALLGSRDRKTDTEQCRFDRVCALGQAAVKPQCRFDRVCALGSGGSETAMSL